jgi:DNA (cytosine-5)-methyltransferase 1
LNFYNENNPCAAPWLRELIKADLIAPGVVDDRSITDLNFDELKQYRQCHFFAGIGGWSHALRLAGWPDDVPVWTASCPCQPFSQAGKRKVDKDERHLWPTLRKAVSIGRPSICFGEQVASKDGRIWLAGVRADLEALGYVVGAADLCAAGVGAPHIRQRLYWVAYSAGSKWRSPAERRNDVIDGENAGWKEKDGRHSIRGASSSAGLVNANGYHCHWWSGPLQVGRNCIEGEIERGGRKYRAQWRVKPGLPLLADGVPGRVGALCGFGNAIVPQVAAEFIQAATEAFQVTHP